MADDLSDLKKADLLALAESLDLATGGTVKALRARIEAAQALAAEPEPEAEPEAEPEPEPEPEAVVEADDGDNLGADDSDVAFVRQAYRDILKREADPSGLSNYVAALSFHGTLTRPEVLEDLKNSQEAQNL